MISAAIKFFVWLVGFFSGEKISDAERLGTKEAENASLNKGIDAIVASDKAAAKVKPSQKAIDDDPNNLDR